MIRPIAIAALCSLAAAPVLAAQSNVNTPIARETTTIIGQKVSPPANATIIASTSIFPPGARTPVHKHLYPHYVFVTEGTLTITNVETGRSYQVPAGHFLVEMLDTWHYGHNDGTVPVRTYVVDQVPDGVKENRVLRETPP
jgi:quercetin dioxygenase-like cupin family protein